MDELETAIQRMQEFLEAWVPDDAEILRVPNGGGSERLVWWRVEFEDGTVARVAFRTDDLTSALESLWATIRREEALQGGRGNYRVGPGGLHPHPDWPGGN